MRYLLNIVGTSGDDVSPLYWVNMRIFGCFQLVLPGFIWFHIYSCDWRRGTQWGVCSRMATNLWCPHRSDPPAQEFQAVRCVAVLKHGRPWRYLHSNTHFPLCIPGFIWVHLVSSGFIWFRVIFWGTSRYLSGCVDQRWVLASGLFWALWVPFDEGYVAVAYW